MRGRTSCPPGPNYLLLSLPGRSRGRPRRRSGLRIPVELFRPLVADGARLLLTFELDVVGRDRRHLVGSAEAVPAQGFRPKGPCLFSAWSLLHLVFRVMRQNPFHGPKQIDGIERPFQEGCSTIQLNKFDEAWPRPMSGQDHPGAGG